MARYTIDQNGNVVFLQSDGSPRAPLEVTPRTNSKSPTGRGKTGANERQKVTPKVKWKPKVTTGFSAAARRRAQEERRRQEQERADQARAAKEASKREEEKLAAVEQLTDFAEAHALGVAASSAPSPDYPLAIAAFKKAYRLDPRRKVRSGSKPEPGLFEVPMKLAAAYRLNGQFHESQKMYEWVLKHHDSRIARTELAAVREERLALAAVRAAREKGLALAAEHEVNCKRSEALKLYKELVRSDPHDTSALRGVARMLDKLGRGVEAREAYDRVRRASRV